MIRRSLAALAVLFLMTGVGCATSPLGRTQFLLQSETEMAAMGIAAFDEMKTTTPLSTNARQRAYVQCIADSITNVLTPQDMGVVVVQGWETELFADDSANAFALPGGRMGVHTGLLNVATTPSQLAAVMGHEVGHVLARHGNERVSQQYAAQGGLVVASIFTGSQTPESQQLLSVLGVGAQVGLMKFSRDHESEADRLGLRLMARAGFDPQEAVTLWENMSRASSGQRPPEILSTHPSGATRIARLSAAMPEAMQLYETARAQGRRPNCR
ncbi:MAG: M48 family metallopeptidase [Myxococcota bacterium]